MTYPHTKRGGAMSQKVWWNLFDDRCASDISIDEHGDFVKTKFGDEDMTEDEFLDIIEASYSYPHNEAGR